MAIFNALITVTKSQNTRGYNETVIAQLGDRYFSTQKKAQAFCQQYASKPLNWLVYGRGKGRMLSAQESKELSFIVTQTTTIVLDTMDKPALPSKFSNND